MNAPTARATPAAVAHRRREPRHLRARAWSRALSLVELMIVIAIGALIIGLAAPSFSDYIVTQRVRSIHAQLATDLQFARSEAISRSAFVSVRFQFTTGASGASCYVIYTRPEPDGGNPITCDCLAAEGSRCAAFPAQTTEVRTVVVPNSLRVSLRVGGGNPDTLTFDPRTGGRKVLPSDDPILVADGYPVDTSADTPRTLRAVVLPSGRPEICTPSSSTLGGNTCAP